MNRDQENRQTLQESLTQLRAELKGLEFRDSEFRQKLEQLISSVELHLEGGEKRTAQPDLLLSAPSTLAQFEIEHPTFAASLRQIISTLSTMGI
jgi:hypothetical protein